MRLAPPRSGAVPPDCYTRLIFEPSAVAIHRAYVHADAIGDLPRRRAVRMLAQLSHGTPQNGS
jgi:hypothetical protein